MSHDPESTLPETEKFTDVLDRASDNEMKTTGFAVQQARKAAIPQQVPRADGTFEVTDCETCGNEIPYQRLLVAVKNKHCIHCATRQERRR
jgi:RNA polymerase-binding transcription factor DksA